MKSPRAVIIPIGVPESGRGLGIGLAALVHGFAKIDGRGIALAQLHQKPTEEGGEPRPVEAFVPPHAWRDLAAHGHAPEDVDVVVTGQLEPPGEGRGSLEIVAFEAKTGHLMARGDAHIDNLSAGKTIVAAFEQAWAPLQGELGSLHDLGELEWDALESVLLAERCALHDPTRFGPHDKLAALLHLGRAVQDAPNARYPAGRLAVLAIETATAPNVDRRVVESAIRALVRASSDAPAQVELLEACAALQIRVGLAANAEVTASSALGLAPSKPRLFVLLSEARRAQGNLDGALEATQRGLERAGPDALLKTERGVVLASRGDLVNAETEWRAVLAQHPRHLPAFINLARLAMSKSDTVVMQSLVDHALEQGKKQPPPHPDMLRQALELAAVGEPEGVARASRIAKLARTILEIVPGEAWAELALARAHAQMGDVRAATDRLVHLEINARETLAGAEAQRGRLALSNPSAAMEVDATVRAAEQAPVDALEKVAMRARRLAAAHGTWTAYLAAGMAERRRGRPETARDDLELGLLASPGASPIHAELARVLSRLGRGAEALAHAQRARNLEGESPRVAVALVESLAALNRTDEAEALHTRAKALFPDDAALRGAALVFHAKPVPSRWGWPLIHQWFSRTKRQ